MHTNTNTNALAHLSDEKLLADLAALVATEREATVTLLAHLAEVDARELYKPTPYPSMFAYCTRVLRLAEAVAYKRIRAARIARQFPQILDAIADGRVHVTGVAMLAPHMTAENVDALIVAATHRTKHELEILVARLAPRPDLPAKLRRLPAPREQPPQLHLDPDPVPAPALERRPVPSGNVQLDPDPVSPRAMAATPPATDSGHDQLDPDPVPPRGLEGQPAAPVVRAPGPLSPSTLAAATPTATKCGNIQLDPDRVRSHDLEGQPAAAAARVPASRSSVKALAPERFALQMTIGQVTRDKLERARLLMLHGNPSGDLAEVIDQALDALLEKLEKAKFGATARPRARKARPADANPRYTQNADKRDIHQRDGERCAWVSDDGARCTERGFLQLDHKTMVCRGGTSGVDTMGVLCHAHNQYEAERQLGADFMREKREQARAARAAKANAKANAKDVAGTIAPENETDQGLALRRKGLETGETQEPVAGLTFESGAPLDERLRAALAALDRSRCKEGPEHPRRSCRGLRVGGGAGDSCRW
jgi:hypothetical protein